MNSISRLFGILRFSAPQEGTRRRRRTRLQGRLIAAETLEPKQLLAIDVANPFADQSLETSSPYTVAITNQFDLTDVLGTVVKFDTNAPIGSASGLSTNDFYVELFDKSGAAATSTPSTVNNFLNYVNDGSYDNTMIHRSVTNFVIQGGGFTAPTRPANEVGSDPTQIQSKGFVPNEPGNSNRRGTIAMAKISGNTNSATSQWYFNLSDNNFLDTDNGGYAVFGKVLGDGMSVVDVMAGAFTYDASLYYGYPEGEGPFTDMPLWNYDTDNILKPEDPVNNRRSDFVEIDKITQQTDESELMTYSVTTSDSSKLAASINAAGDLVLTPVAGQTGSVSVTVTATSKTDGSTASDTFAVGLGGGDPEEPGPTLTAIESFGGTVLNKDQSGNLYAGTTQILQANGQPLNVATYSSFNYSSTDIRAEVVAETNSVLLVHAVSGNTWVLEFDETWTATGVNNVLSDATTQHYDAEIDFTIDANQDGALGRPLHTNVTILSEHSDGRLLVNGQIMTLNGAPIDRSTYSSLGYSVIRTALIDSVTHVLFVKPNRSLAWDWTLNSDGSQAAQAVIPYGTNAFYAAEVTFDVDVNVDGSKGLPALSVVEADGSTTLHEDGSGRLYVDGTAVMAGDSHLNRNRYAAWNYDGLAAEVVSGENRLVFTNSANGRIWELAFGSGDFWQFSAANNLYRPGFKAYYEAEVTFHVDANGDGSVGTPSLTLLSSKGINVHQNADGIIFVNGLPLQRGSSTVTTASYSAYGYTNYYAVQNGDNITLFIEHVGKKFWAWELTSDLGFISDSLARRGTTAFFNAETILSEDSNQDGSVGLPALSAYETGGETAIYVEPSSNAIFINSTPIFKNGSAVTTNQFASFGYTDVSAERNRGENNIIFRKQNVLWVWVMTLDWTAVAEEIVIRPDDSRFFDLEAVHGFDANSDNMSGQAVSQLGGTTMTKTADGRLYADGKAIKRNGDGISESTYASFNYVTIRAATVNGVKVVALKHTNGKIWEWSVNENWEWVSDVAVTDSGIRYDELNALF